MKNIYFDELEERPSWQTWYKEFENIKDEELKMFSKYFIEKYNKMIEVYNEKIKKVHPLYKLNEKNKEELERLQKNKKIFENLILEMTNRLSTIEKAKQKINKKYKIALENLPVDFFKEEETLREFIKLNLELLPEENTFLLDKEMFNIKFHMEIPERGRQSRHLDKNRIIDKVGVKLLYYYIKEIQGNEVYSILQLDNITGNALNINEYTVDTGYDRRANIIKNIHKQVSISNNKDIKSNSRYKCNILKINLEGCNYNPNYCGAILNRGFENKMRLSIEYYESQIKEGTCERASEELYKKYLERDLEELGIWSKFAEINEDGQYEIYINLDDWDIPYDKDKVAKLQEKQRLDSAYLEAEKACINSQIQDLEDKVIILLENNEQKEILKQIYNIKDMLEKQDKPLASDEKEKLTALLNKIENQIKSILEEKIYEIDRSNESLFTDAYASSTKVISEIAFPYGKLAKTFEEYFCEETVIKNSKLIDEVDNVDEKMKLLEKMKKAHLLLGEVLDKKSFIEELYWRKKYKLLMTEAVYNFFLGKDEKIFLKYCTEDEINEANWHVESKYYEINTLIWMESRNYVVDDLENIVKKDLIEKANWRFEYLQIPIYELEDFIINKDANEDEKITFMEFIEKNRGKKYSIMDIHKILKELGMLEKVKFNTRKEQNINTPKNWQYRIYEDTKFDEEMKKYIEEVDLKIRDNEEIPYVQYFKDEDLFIRL